MGFALRLLVEAVAQSTGRRPIFEAPFTDAGGHFADAWYKVYGGAPDKWVGPTP